ncbi:MAG TPA: hypothetical protein VIJ42_07570 [Stellaceae bacterium]
MYTMTTRKRFAGKLRGAALGLAIAGVTAGAFAIPALAQESVTTTRTTTYYGTQLAPTTYYTEPAPVYTAGPSYYQDSYMYPPEPAYTYVQPGPPPAPIAGVTVGVPGFGVHLGF